MSAPSWMMQNPQPSTATATPVSEGVDSPVGGPSNDTVTSSPESSSLVTPVQGASTGVVTPSTYSSASASGPAPAVVVPAAPVSSVVTPQGVLLNANDPSQDPVRAKFASSPGYIVPAPSFTYSVFPRNSASGSVQLSSSVPALKLTPPMPAAALQPPVPGQFLGNRPFSYNVVSHPNVVSATGQQFQLATAPNQAQVQSGKFAPVMSGLSLQPPVPGQVHRPNTIVPGTLAPNPLAPLQLTMPISRSANYSFTGSSQSSTAGTSDKILPSEKAAADAACGPLVGSHSTQLSLSNSSSLSASLTNPSSNSSSVPMAAVPSFTAHPVVPGIAGTPGLPVVPNTEIVKPIVSTPASSRPILPSPASLSSSTSVPITIQAPVLQGAQQQIYMPYPSQPGTAPPPQAFWAHPLQSDNKQHTSFLPFPGVLPSPFPLPMHAPSVALLPSVQPPGVPPVVAQEEMTSISAGSLHMEKIFAAESSFPSIDQDKKANDLPKDKEDVINKEIDAWTAHKTETGAIYYYNSVTGESTYEKPSSFKLEPVKLTAQSIPVSWEKLDGTDWTLVITNDGKKYYYDNKNKISSWHVPPEVLELKKNQESDSTKGNATQLQNGSALTDGVPASVSLSTATVQIGGRDSTALRTSGAPVSSSALDLIKKKLQEAGGPGTTSPLQTAGPAVSDINGLKATEIAARGQQAANNKDKVKDATGDENMSDSSSDSDDEESGPSKEECIVQFKEMLKERGVAPFSKWEKELPKIVFDPRFKAVPSHSARRALFEHYVRTRAEEERKEKRAAQKAATDSFKQLLEEASEDIDRKTDYYTFKRKWGSDPRFEAVDRKERELLLNEKVKACEEKMQALRMAAASSFKSMLQEDRDITMSSRWLKVKDSLRNDPRYKAVKHEDREILFNEYISELKAAEDVTRRALNAKKDEQEKLKERERELRKRKVREEEEMEKVKLKVRKKEAEYLFRALLVETIKDPKASWTESKPKLDKDPQGRATNPDLSQKDAEKLFREHVKDLYERCANDFCTLLAEVITPEAAAQAKNSGKTILNSWSEAKLLLKPDPRYAKMPSKDRESLWLRHADDMRRKLKLESNPKEKSDTDGKSRILSTDPTRKSPRRSGKK